MKHANLFRPSPDSTPLHTTFSSYDLPTALTHSFIKKGRVALLHDMGSEAEIEVRTLGPNENFGLDEKAVRDIKSVIKQGALIG